MNYVHKYNSYWKERKNITITVSYRSSDVTAQMSSSIPILGRDLKQKSTLEHKVSLSTDCITGKFSHDPRY